MKAAVSFLASKLPAAISPSVVHHDGLQFKDKAELLAWIGAQSLAPASDLLMMVHCQCGAEYSYPTRESIPEANLRCSCGRGIIVYG